MIGELVRRGLWEGPTSEEAARMSRVAGERKQGGRCRLSVVFWLREHSRERVPERPRQPAGLNDRRGPPWSIRPGCGGDRLRVCTGLPRLLLACGRYASDAQTIIATKKRKKSAIAATKTAPTASSALGSTFHMDPSATLASSGRSGS